MPTINYHLTTDIEITKDKLKDAVSYLGIDGFELGNDNRTWNRKQLQALKLLLCNVVEQGNRKKIIFIYSRANKQIPTAFNPFNISYSSLKAVIDMLGNAGIIDHIPAKPRRLGDKLKESKMSEFTVTQLTKDLADSLGIKKNVTGRKAIKEEASFFVRLRDRQNKNLLLEYEPDPYTEYVDKLMSDYCAYLNKFAILLPLDGKVEDEQGNAVGKHYGYETGGERIHLFRNFRNWNQPLVTSKGVVLEDYSREFEILEIKTKNPNMSFGGRSGSFWQGALKTDRPFTLMTSKTKKVDIPASHINLCYYNATGKWFQEFTNKELIESGKPEEDAYYLKGIHRDIVKQFVQIMFNVKGRPAASRSFNKWLREECDPKLAEAHIKTGITNVHILNQLDDRHSAIKDYFYKGKLAGQIISWEEVNMIHQLAWDFIQKYEVPVITVYDEMICPELHHQLLIDWWQDYYHRPNLYNEYSLMNQIPYL